MVSRKSKYQDEDEKNKVGRFYYEGGDRNDLTIFHPLHSSTKLILRSLYLEFCQLKSVDLLESLDGCNNLTTIKLYQVVVDHSVDFEDGELHLKDYYRGIHLPKLTSLHVNDVSNAVNDVLYQAFHRDSENVPLTSSSAQKLALYNVDFYSQLLCQQLKGGRTLRLLAQLSNLKVDVNISLAGYKMFLWHQSTPECEKLIISPLLTSSWNDNFLKNFVDAATVKYLSCSDYVLSLESTPYNLEELNLWLGKENSSLLIDLSLSKKLNNLSTLVLHFEKKFMIDLKILALNLHKLNDLIITKAVIHSTASEPLKVAECCFDKCSFSENFMENVSRFLDCNKLALDINQVRNWDGIFKSNLMKMPAISRILTWSVIVDSSNENDKKEDEIVFGKEYILGMTGTWESRLFDNDSKFRRSVLLHHHDFFQDDYDWDQQNAELIQRRSNVNDNLSGLSTFERRTLAFGKFIAIVVCGIAIFSFYLMSRRKD